MNELTKVFRKLNSPSKIQDFLNSIPFNFEKKGDTLMSPLRVWKAQTAHCLEGALFAAAALNQLGEPPLLLDLRSTKQDYDHVVALFKRNGKWGAISKTNHAVLRYREPIYPTLQALALSYFHEYFLDDGTKTLRSYSTKPYKLSTKDLSWMTSEEELWKIGAELDDMPHTDILTKQEIKKLRKADKIEIEAGKIVEFRPVQKSR